MAPTGDFPKICEWPFPEYNPGQTNGTQSSNVSHP